MISFLIQALFGSLPGNMELSDFPYSFIIIGLCGCYSTKVSFLSGEFNNKVAISAYSEEI